MRRGLFFACGLLFAIGLALAGMTRPEKVIGFLDFGGRWDPSLAFVMAGAVLVYFTADRLSRSLRRPIYAPTFPARGPERIELKLLAGAALFGVGWGLSGFCPGPALVSVGAGSHAALWFVPSMIAGLWIHRAIAPRSTGCSS